MSKNKNKILVNGKVFVPAKLNEEWLKEPARDESLKEIYNDDYFISLIPEGCKYFAIDEKNEKIYGLGFNYKEKMEKQISNLEAKLAETVKDYEELVNKQKQEIREYDKEDMRLRDYAKSLEQQLADKDRQLEVMRELKNRHFNYYKTCETECNQLKQQLAEKEKLIEFYINSGKEQCEEINKLNHRALNYCDAIDKANQDKISFAVSKLEKVSDWIIQHRVKPFFEERYIVYTKSLQHMIQEEIEKLKEGK